MIGLSIFRFDERGFGRDCAVLYGVDAHTFPRTPFRKKKLQLTAVIEKGNHSPRKYRYGGRRPAVVVDRLLIRFLNGNKVSNQWGLNNENATCPFPRATPKLLTREARHCKSNYALYLRRIRSGMACLTGRGIHANAGCNDCRTAAIDVGGVRPIKF
ncbi:hypothetical protein EVAR_52152_1 [Eumeta japonica]|uniref:Uncharacterized protein n=1 Tax=Eumeta variegata TaxID=151549 RepID=A0A4C1YEB5_EUMVA|nr:hypothetical protein EVAR_52152_1 [Eumeta japonica]